MYIQIVNFRLRPDSSRAVFLLLAEEMAVWLKDREGFAAYELYEGQGCWADRIVWTERIFAEQGLRDFLLTACGKKIVDLVADDYSTFLGHEVVSAYGALRCCLPGY